MFHGPWTHSEKLAAVAWLCFSFAASSALAGDYSFTRIGGGNFNYQPTGVSADGSVVVGKTEPFQNGQAFQWTRAGGIGTLGNLPGANFSDATGVSGDGLVIVGNSYSASIGEAYRWTSGTGMVGLGDLPGGAFGSHAACISADGKVIVGTSSSATGSELFRWTSESGMIGVGKVPGAVFTTPTGISADGSVIVGYSETYEDFNLRPTAFRWTSSEGFVSLGQLPANCSYSVANGISADGSVIVGYVGRLFTFDGVTYPAGNEAFRWTNANGFNLLEDEQVGFNRSVRGVSTDGSVMVGASGMDVDAFVWTPPTGTIGLVELLIAHGVPNLGPGSISDITVLESPTAISADGRTIVGYGVGAWVATIPEPSTLILAGIGFLLLVASKGRRQCWRSR